MCLRQRKRRHKHIKSVSFTLAYRNLENFKLWQEEVKLMLTCLHVGFTFLFCHKVFQNLDMQREKDVPRFLYAYLSNP